MKNTLICTLGTSLFKPNLLGLPTADTYNTWLSKQPKADQEYLSLKLIEDLKTALSTPNWKSLAELLGKIPGTTRLCGAEINSITDLINRKYCTEKCLLVLCHSATDEGRHIAKIMQDYYQAKGHTTKLVEIEHLQDAEPKLFRTKGLRNLAKQISKTIRENLAESCAINATGGYKAQIAIGVLMGQALGVPVYYKHEQFSEIIAFPPMPIGLDFSLWLEKNELLTALERVEKLKDLVELQDVKDLVEWQDVEDEWDERMEPLVERVPMNGKVYLELSPTGQIFHETFKGRFESVRDHVLPAPVLGNQKRPPRLSNHNWGNARQPILDFMQKIINECPYVRTCYTDYWNPNLSSPVLFRMKRDKIEGIFSNGSWTVKFIVETSANNRAQCEACVADLNWFTEN
jgi:putative CRISPR-associated protein (TIGR02619 family)